MSFVIIVDTVYAAKGYYEWHVGTPKPKFTVPDDVSIIKLLQASGNELELIKERFANVPYSHSICTWRGDLAQFIYDNL